MITSEIDGVNGSNIVVEDGSTITGVLKKDGVNGSNIVVEDGSTITGVLG